MVGGPVYVGGWMEGGSAFTSLRDAQWHEDLSTGLLLDTLIGPMFAGGSFGFDGHGRLYIGIGQVWH